MFIEAMYSSGSGGEKILVDTWNITRGGSQSKEIDCTSVPNYQNLTADDFDIDITGTTFQVNAFAAGSGSWITADYAFTKAYNPTTGKLTVSLTKTGSGNIDTPIGSVKVISYSNSGGGGSQGITIPSLTFNSSLRDTTSSSYVNQSIPFDVSGYSLLTIDRLTIQDLIRSGGGIVSITADDSTTLYSGQAVGSTSVDVSNLSYDISAYSVVKFNLTINRYSECRTNITNIQIS